MSSSKLKPSFGGRGGALVGFGGLSRNRFGGGNIMSSLMLFRGTGLGFMLSFLFYVKWVVVKQVLMVTNLL